MSSKSYLTYRTVERFVYFLAIRVVSDRVGEAMAAACKVLFAKASRRGRSKLGCTSLSQVALLLALPFFYCTPHHVV